MIIDGNVYRALMRIEKNPDAIDLLVDAEYREDIKKLFDVKDSQFELKDEFTKAYKLVQSYLDSLTAIETPEDLNVVKEAQKFLTFIMRNEEKLAGIEAVKAFKEAVLAALDEADPILRDKVISALEQGNA